MLRYLATWKSFLDFSRTLISSNITECYCEAINIKLGSLLDLLLIFFFSLSVQIYFVHSIITMMVACICMTKASFLIGRKIKIIVRRTDVYWVFLLLLANFPPQQRCCETIAGKRCNYTLLVLVANCTTKLCEIVLPNSTLKPVPEFVCQNTLCPNSWFSSPLLSVDILMAIQVWKYTVYYSLRGCYTPNFGQFWKFWQFFFKPVKEKIT